MIYTMKKRLYDSVMEITLNKTPVYYTEKSKFYKRLSGVYYISLDATRESGRFRIAKSKEDFTEDDDKIVGWVKFKDVRFSIINELCSSQLTWRSCLEKRSSKQNASNPISPYI